MVRHTKVFAFLLLPFLFFSPSLFAFSPADPAQAYSDGINHLFNLDFAEAETVFRALTKDHPDNPDYWNVLGTTYWLKILYNQQKLDFESFSGKDRFGTIESRDAGFEADEKQLRETVSKAMAAADAMLKKDPKSARAHYAKGSSYATLASFEATIRRSNFTAARNAKNARDEHLLVLRLDPNFHDAHAAVGIYNYAVGSLPLFVRLTLRLVGLGNGDKAGGIKDMEFAALNGTRAATDAKMLLVVVYGREALHEKALTLVKELHARYPRNFMLDMSKASIYGRMKRWDLAAQTYREMAGKIMAHTNGYERMRIEKVYYELANSQFQGEKFAEAAATFDLVVRGAGASPNEKANSHLWMGRMADTRKERDEALRHYNAVLEIECDPSLKSDARGHIKRPFGR